jgi:hypothetical protein
MPKSLTEILHLTWERQEKHLKEMSCLELQVLFFELNRINVHEDDQPEFDRFHRAVCSLVQDCEDSKESGVSDAP